MGTLMQHVEYLSETIGPRPATTDAEVRAAEYVRDAFESRGLDVEVQEFDSPRTYSWAYVIYHLLTIAAAVASLWAPVPALLVGLAVAVVLWLDLDTRWGLSALMPKGTSRNVIARHCPRVGRGERVARVVVVAHVDSARSSLAFSPAMVKNFAATFGLLKACTVAVPVLIAVRMVLHLLPVARAVKPVWSWYVVLAAAAYLVVPLLINVHRELFMRFTPGANDNASGVAAMLGVFERLVPEPDAATLVARENARMRDEEAAWAADVVPDGAVLSYAPAPAPAASPVASRPVTGSWADDEDEWTDTRPSPSRPVSDPLARPTAEQWAALDDEPPLTGTDAALSAKLFGTGAIMPRPTLSDDIAPRPAGFLDEPTGPTAPAPRPPAREHAPDLGFDVELDEAPAPRPRASAAPATGGWEDDDGQQALFGRSSASATPPPPAPPADRPAPRRSTDHERSGVHDWLGVDGDFDARVEGRSIGSWDNFDDDEGEPGWKGGAAGVDSIDDPGFAASEAARIRRKVTMNVDRELVEKEVWFVATGAEEVGTVGMRAFLREYADELAGAAIINLDNIGTGTLAYVTREGMARRYDADRRLLGAARRAAREADLPVKGREYRGLSTDATPALARGMRAMSVMAFDINGRLPNWHWSTDTADQVSESNLDLAVSFVSALIREL